MNNKCTMFNILSKTTREQGSKFVHMTCVGSSSLLKFTVTILERVRHVLMSLALPTTRERCFFILLTATSHSSPK